MRIPRIYHPEPLQTNTTISLCDDAAHHVGRVLRMSVGQKIELFDGSNHTFSAEITEATKKVFLSTLKVVPLMTASPH